MDYQSRKALVDKLQELELKYEVQLWGMEGVQIWPLIKKLIFFYNYELSKKSSKVGTVRRNYIKSKIDSLFKRVTAYFSVYFLKIKKSELLFSGAPSHRIPYKDGLINRYFDPIIDHLERDYTVAEYVQLPNEAIYKVERVVDLSAYYPVFVKKRSFKKDWDKLQLNEDFSAFLDELDSRKLIPLTIFKNKLFSNLKGILNWKDLFVWYIKKLETKVTFGLCYYNQQMYGLNLAARELNIPCVDMQHGTQGSLHIAYNIQKHPANGYNLLPTVFWVWDELSKKQLEENLNPSLYKVIKGGNPSLTFFGNENLTFDYDHKMPVILITVQPLAEILPDYIYRSIQETAGQYNWWIRLHPRMKRTEVDVLFQKLKDFNITDEVKVDVVTEIPLPQVLDATDLHISKYSGTISEASIMEVKTIIIDQLGIDSYQEIINQKFAFPFYLNDEQAFLSLVTELLNTDQEEKSMQELNYKEYIDEIIQ